MNTTDLNKHDLMSMEKAYHAKIDLVYVSRVYAILAMSVSAVLVYIMLYPRNDLVELKYWLIALLLVDVYRLIGVIIYKIGLKSGNVNYKQAEILLFSGTALSGLAWGSLAIFLLPVVDDVSKLIITGMLAGICAGSTTTLTYIYKLALLFILLVMLPMIYGVFMFGGDEFIPVMIMLGVYMLFLLKNMGVFYGNTAEVLRLKAESIVREQELDIQHKKVEQANHAKSVFLANMSHELRTPMHAILGFSDLGTSNTGKVPEKKLSNYFARINESGQRLLRLLDGLLDLSKLEAGRMIFDYSHQDLQHTISTVIEEFADEFREHSLTVDVEPADHDTTATYDENKIAQVVRNLLSNAIRYTPDGRTIMFYFQDSELEQDDAIPGDSRIPAISVSIEDQGTGIPDGEYESVFDSFVQSSKTSTGAGGTGLGLSICKEIISHHEGRISATNSAGGGAIFTFSIPRHGPRQAAI